MDVNDETSRCLSEDQLEAIAGGQSVDRPPMDHMSGCETCRAAVEQIRENNTFLERFVPAVTASAQGVERAERPSKVDALSADAIPNYQIVREIHRGGQGVVYEAVQMATKRTVALKMLLAGVFATPRQRRRFEREIEVASGLRHPNIVTLYETQTLPDGRMAFSMEHVHGRHVDVWSRGLQGRPGLTAIERHRLRLRMFAKVCSAVQYAHQRGVIHRDLKPGNVLVDNEDEPHVLDFGLAKVDVDNDGERAGMTLSGEFLGSPAYASPEQVSGRPHAMDTRSDVYALGVVLYELLTGKMPYAVDVPMAELLRNIAETEPQRPSNADPSLGDEETMIVLKALAKDPGRRYQSAGSFGRDIERFLSGQPIEAKRDSTWYVFRKAAWHYRRTISLAATLIVLAALLLTISMIQREHLAGERLAMQAEATERVARDRDAAERSAHALAISLRDSTIARARAATQLGNIPLALDLLWQAHLAPPEGTPSAQHPEGAGPIDSYWALWELYAQHPCLIAFDTGDASSGSLAISSDGQALATSSRDGMIRFFDPTDGREMGRIQTGHKPYARITFSPDPSSPRLLASTGGEGRIKLWDVETLSCLREWPAHEGAVHRLGFLTDGHRLVSVGADGWARVWNVADPAAPRLLRELSLGTPLFGRLALSREQARLAVKLDSGDMRVWDLDTGNIVAASESMGPYEPLTFAGPTSALALTDRGLVRLWNPETDQITLSPPQHNNNVHDLICSNDGQHLFSASSDKTIGRWELPAFVPLGVFKGHTSAVIRLSALPSTGPTSAAAFASVDQEGAVRIWEDAPNRGMAKLPSPPMTVFGVAFVSGDRLAFCGGEEDPLKKGQVGIADVAAHTLLTGAGPELADIVAAVAVSPDRQLIATGGYDGFIRLWQADSLAPVAAWEAHSNQIHSLSFHPSAQWLVSGANFEPVRVWNVNRGVCALELPNPDPSRVPSVSISSDGHLIAAALGSAAGGAALSMADKIPVWEFDTGASVSNLVGHPGGVRIIAFAPPQTVFGEDRRILATGGDDWNIKLWDADTGECLATLSGSLNDLFALSFHPGGRLLASGGREGVVRLWDLQTRRELAAIDTGANMVFSLAFSPDGKRLAVGGAPSLAGVWDLSYYDRHIAGNLAYHMRRLEAAGIQISDKSQRLAWADRALNAGASDGTTSPIAP